MVTKATLLMEYVTIDRKKLKVGDWLVLIKNYFTSPRHKELKFPRTWVYDNPTIFKIEKIED